MSGFVLEVSWLAGQQASSLPLGWLVSAGPVELGIDRGSFEIAVVETVD
jgi:hypothetical protein